MQVLRAALTVQQKQEWEKTRTALMWHCPAFTFILMTMMDKLKSEHIAVFTKDVPTAATDGVGLLINPDYFFQFPLPKRMFIVAHEICHAMLNHMISVYQWKQWGKVKLLNNNSLPYDHDTMDRAMDLVINDMLIECKGEGSRPIFEFHQDWLHDKSIATKDDSVVDAYSKLYKKKQQNSGKKGSGDGASGQCFDQHLDPGATQGKDPAKAMQDHNPTEWQTAIAAAMQAAKLQGKLPGALESFVKTVLEPRVSWQEHIVSLFARKIGSGGYDWKRPDRRLIVRDIYAPGRSGFGCNTIVVGGDSSGSVNDLTIAMFFGELAGMLEDLRPKRIVVMWCDHQVHRVDEIEDACDIIDCRRKGVPGRGGTSFIPVFEEIAAMGLQPDALIYLTDMDGCFPKHAPDYPVIWGSIRGKEAPFGDVVEIPLIDDRG